VHGSGCNPLGDGEAVEDGVSVHGLSVIGGLPPCREVHNRHVILQHTHLMREGGQDRTGQDRTGQDRTGQDRTGRERGRGLDFWRKKASQTGGGRRHHVTHVMSPHLLDIVVNDVSQGIGVMPTEMDCFAPLLFWTGLKCSAKCCAVLRCAVLLLCAIHCYGVICFVTMRSPVLCSVILCYAVPWCGVFLRVSTWQPNTSPESTSRWTSSAMPPSLSSPLTS
jgi:hypothetical protein